MTALLSVFSHVINKPTLASAKNDIALMEVVIGFFGRLEFLTSGIAAFTKASDIVRKARDAVERVDLAAGSRGDTERRGTAEPERSHLLPTVVHLRSRNELRSDDMQADLFDRLVDNNEDTVMWHHMGYTSIGEEQEQAETAFEWLLPGPQLLITPGQVAI